jgi:hypothetical protein
MSLNASLLDVVQFKGHRFEVYGDTLSSSKKVDPQIAIEPSPFRFLSADVGTISLALKCTSNKEHLLLRFVFWLTVKKRGTTLLQGDPQGPQSESLFFNLNVK